MGFFTFLKLDKWYQIVRRTPFSEYVLELFFWASSVKRCTNKMPSDFQKNGCSRVPFLEQSCRATVLCSLRFKWLYNMFLFSYFLLEFGKFFHSFTICLEIASSVKTYFWIRNSNENDLTCMHLPLIHWMISYIFKLLNYGPSKIYCT